MSLRKEKFLKYSPLIPISYFRDKIFKMNPLGVVLNAMCIYFYEYSNPNKNCVIWCHSLGLICMQTSGSPEVFRQALGLHEWRNFLISKEGLCVKFWNLWFTTTTPNTHTHSNPRSRQPKNITCFKLCSQIGSKDPTSPS